MPQLPDAVKETQRAHGRNQVESWAFSSIRNRWVLMRKEKSLQRGQGMIEYVVVLAVVVFLLTHNEPGQPDAIDRLNDALKSRYNGYGTALSIPTESLRTGLDTDKGE